MKVLMINVVCGIRSTGRICTDLAVALEAQGHEVKIAYGREDVPEQFQKYAVRIGNDLDVKLHGLKARLMDGAGFGSKRVTEKFIKWVKEYDPDVIHLHNIHGYYINVEVLFKYLKECGKKIIWTLHDCWSFTGHCVYFDYVNCDKWKIGCKHCPQKAEYPARIGPDMSKQHYALKKKLFTDVENMILVTPSQWLADLIAESYMKEYRTKVIYNGVDTSVFKPTKSKDQIEQLPRNIIGIERTNSIKELVELYSAAEVFVNPTLEDNYPTTNIEAIACGTPVITYETGGSFESAGMYGMGVPKMNIEMLIKAIKEIDKVNLGTVDIDYKNTVNKYIMLYEKI